MHAVVVARTRLHKSYSRRLSVYDYPRGWCACVCFFLSFLRCDSDSRRAFRVIIERIYKYIYSLDTWCTFVCVYLLSCSRKRVVGRSWQNKKPHTILFTGGKKKFLTQIHCTCDGMKSPQIQQGTYVYTVYKRVDS